MQDGLVVFQDAVEAQVELFERLDSTSQRNDCVLPHIVRKTPQIPQELLTLSNLI